MSPQRALAVFPTILLLERDPAPRLALAKALRRHRYLVLEAQDVPKAIDLVKMQSRPIHLLLMGLSFDDAIATTIRQYRPNLHVLRVTGSRRQPAREGVLTLESAPEMIRQFFTAPQSDGG
jgi:DNA-binding response OmpR family regulator